MMHMTHDAGSRRVVLPCMQADHSACDVANVAFEELDCEELDCEEELRKRDCYARLNYESMQTANPMQMRKNYKLYEGPPALGSEHAVICITHMLRHSAKLMVKIPHWCMSPTSDRFLPKVYDSPQKVLLHDPSKKQSIQSFVTGELVYLYTKLLQGDDLEREVLCVASQAIACKVPRASSQPISCQALNEGYRIRTSDAGDMFYAQTCSNNAIYMIPSTSFTKKQILRCLNLAERHSNIEIQRFTAWEDVKDYCCGGA